MDPSNESVSQDGPLQEIPNSAEKHDAAEEIVRRHMLLSMAGGLIPVPLLDLAAVTSVQLDMLKKLAAVYEVDLDSGSARAFVTSLTSALGITGVARMGATLIKLVPGLGTLAGGVTQLALNGASTYAVGTLFTRLFREGKNIDALTGEMVRDEFQSYLSSGQQVANSILAEGPGQLFRRGKSRR